MSFTIGQVIVRAETPSVRLDGYPDGPGKPNRAQRIPEWALGRFVEARAEGRDVTVLFGSNPDSLLASGSEAGWLLRIKQGPTTFYIDSRWVLVDGLGTLVLGDDR